MNAIKPAVAVVLHPIERRMRHIVGALLVMLFIVYMYFTAAMMLHAVLASRASDQAAEAAGRIAALEVKYFAMADTLTAERAGSLGLAPVSEKHFVNRVNSLR